MAYLHLRIIGLNEDTDTDGKPRVRLQVQEFQPRTLNVNLKNASANQINSLKSMVGGDAMLPIREGMMNGQTFFQLQVAEEIIPINMPVKIPVSGTSYVSSVESGKSLNQVKQVL